MNIAATTPVIVTGPPTLAPGGTRITAPPVTVPLPILNLPRAPENRSNLSGVEGDANVVPITAEPRIVRGFPEELLKMTGQVIRLSARLKLFRKALFYGISSFTNPQTPVANLAPLQLGFSSSFLPITIPAWNGYWGYEVEAQDQHVYDLSSFWAYGNAGDALFYTLV